MKLKCGLECYGIIYKIQNKINGKVYIGQTIQGFNKRYSCKGNGIERVYNFYNNRKNRNIKINNRLFNSINYYGFDAFEVIEVFDIAFSKEELDIKEKCWISIFNSCERRLGYNNTYGGNTYVFSNEIKEYLKDVIYKKALKGEKCHSANFSNNEVYNIKRDISNGVNPRKVMDIYNINYKYLKRIIELDTWKSVGSEFNDKIKNIKIPYENRKTKIIMFDKLMNKLYEFDSIEEAGKITKSNYSNICQCINFKTIICNNYVWLKNDLNLNKNIKKKKEDLVNNNLYMIAEIDELGNEIKIYNSASECAKELNLDISSILKVCNGKLKHTKGYRFIKKYVVVDEII